MLTLYFCPGLCSLASHITIEETGTPYDEKVVNVMKGEHMGGDYLKVNPRHKVPALDIDGTSWSRTPRSWPTSPSASRRRS